MRKREKFYEKQDAQYRGYVTLLKRARSGDGVCTEPIAIAYAALTGGSCTPEGRYKTGGYLCQWQYHQENVKSVTVPNTGGRKGIQSAAAIGIIAGDPTLGLEVISHVRTEQIAQWKAFLKDSSVCTS